MPNATLGPWGKWYATTDEDTAHYTDAQFRAWAKIFGLGVRYRGELPKLRPIRALIGSENADFLISEGRLAVDGDVVTIVGWATYQAPVDRTNADRQARFRERHSTAYAPVDNVVDNVSPDVSNAVTRPFSTTSTSTYSYDEESSPSTSDAVDDHDSLDRYYELTGSYPWGRRPATWLHELQEAHGVVNVVAALEVEWEAAKVTKDLLGRVAARLERQAFRVAEAKKREPKPVDPVQAQLREALRSTETADPLEVAAEPDPEAIAAGRAMWAAFRGNLGGGNGASHGPEPVLHSRNGGQGKPLTDVGTPGSPAPTRGSGRSSPSSLNPTVRPSASGPPEVPTDGTTAKETA